MNGIIHSFRDCIKYVLISAVLLMIFLFLSAVLISAGTLSAELMELLAVIGVIVVSLIGSFLTVRRSGEPRHGFVFAAAFFGLLVICSFFVCGLGGFNASMIKRIISIFAGTIIGNLLGRRQYYKLRNSRKRRKITTK